jgi:Methyltransferase domain
MAILTKSAARKRHGARMLKNQEQRAAHRLARFLSKTLLPSVVIDRLRRHRLKRDMQRSRTMTRATIFTDIYRNNLWDGLPGEYSSGTGSQDDVIGAYVDLVRRLIKEENVMTIADLGCGDFKVGRRIASPEVAYTGCDVVPELIDRNIKAFGRSGVSFRVTDLVTDPLPDADLAIIRQVFQHLSNSDVASVLRKARKYRLVLVTDEQIRSDTASANPDMLPYHGTRRAFGSGLKLERAPFHEEIEVMLEHSSGAVYGADTHTYLRTVLIRNELAQRSQHEVLPRAAPL